MVVKSRDWITAEERGCIGLAVETGYRLENRHMEFQEGGGGGWIGSIRVDLRLIGCNIHGRLNCLFVVNFTVGFSYERLYTFGLYCYSASLLGVSDLICVFQFEFKLR
jgi:hypothetical protein